MKVQKQVLLKLDSSGRAGALEEQPVLPPLFAYLFYYSSFRTIDQLETVLYYTGFSRGTKLIELMNIYIYLCIYICMKIYTYSYRYILKAYMNMSGLQAVIQLFQQWNNGGLPIGQESSICSVQEFGCLIWSSV